jgi:hypothetical protein
VYEEVAEERVAVGAALGEAIAASGFAESVFDAANSGNV